MKRILFKLCSLLLAGSLMLFSSACLSGRRITGDPTPSMTQSEEEEASQTQSFSVSIQTIRKGYLTVGCDPGWEPFSYYENGSLTGFEVDLLLEMCRSLNLELEIVTMDYEVLMTSCMQKRVDCVVGISYSDERAEILYASVPYYSDTTEEDPFDLVIYSNSRHLTLILDNLLKTYGKNGVMDGLIDQYF